MNFLPKKSAMALLTVYVSLWLVISMVAGTILNDYEQVINAALGLTGYRIETVNTEGEDLEYFKSKYVQYDADGNILYTTDENGYTHQVYDDVALREAAIDKANQVQREGTTILWNSDDNGLPLAKGNKVSLFSHSTVDWVYCGASSGRAWTQGASDMKKALTNAGLSINNSLWDFYRSGGGKNYVRTEKTTINEVPWSAYTDAVKNSFASYGDAAIIVLSRKGGEGYANPMGTDNTSTLADTPSGDYFDLSREERDMLSNVVALKKAGTFKKVIVLLNTPTDIWFDPLFDYKDDIDCCMWVCSTGYQGLNEIGKILVGDSVPSGHLVDTFLQNTRSNPVFANSVATLYSNANSMNLINLGYQGTYIAYAEGIYLGYKYYETRYEDAVMGKGNATSTAGAVNSASGWVYSEEVAFPFGYGLTYTEFKYSNFGVELMDDGNYNVTITVTNIGDTNGKDAVQIYVQKPYTEYDKQYGIEQASVNLAGYAKTPELKPGESVIVSIIVRDDALKTYDANNAKTYIREAGDYYIVAAHDAHDAVNNILAAKGYTPENTNGVMDAAGNSTMTHKLTFAEDDFTTYSVSEITGKPITNQFDDTDWNKYANKTDEAITYLSRNDWQATYPTSVVQLSMNDKMVGDLAYDKIPEANPNDKMPLFEQEHVLNLIDLKDVEYDSPLWDTLLNQLSLDDMIRLLGTAYHGTKEITSIAKPAELTKDGPMGVRQPYLTNSNEYTMSFPSNTLLAASYNDQLAYEVGYLMGEDMLHAGITGIYGVGSNIHRSSYSARNFEYYSEDGFISGMMVKYQTAGIQETGCYVNVKHIVLNDQETNRHGICTWANEQTIREIYLPAVEYVAQEATGFMSGFNRLGTAWTGAHKGLLTNVLREEWGFEGFVISDCAWAKYMGVVSGLMAGNDCVLDNIDLANYDSAKENATVALAVREAVHRILYVTVNSNAMNGISKGTKIVEVDEWWQLLVNDVQKWLTIAAVVLFILTIIRMLLPGDSESDPNPIVTVLALVVAIAVAVGSIAVPMVLNQLPMDYITQLKGEEPSDDTVEDEPEAPSLKEQLDGEYFTYKFEAECAETTIDSTMSHVGTQGKSPSAINYPSGGMFIFKLEESKSATITFNVTSTAAQKAVLSVNMGCREYAIALTDLFTIKVNGVEIEIDPEIIYPIYSKVQYYDWLELDVIMVDLVEGNNVIELVRKPGKDNLNLDYIALYATNDVKWTSELTAGHTYENWTLATEPTLTESGSVQKYCKTCRDLQTAELPAISEANGYTKTITDAGTSNGFGSAKWTITMDGVSFSFGSGTYPENAQSYKFEAEKTIFSGSDIRLYNEITSGASGGTYLGKVDGSNWSITLEINSDRACYAMFVAVISEHNNKSFKIGDGRTLTVNGEKVTIPADLVTNVADSENTYYNWEEFEIAVIELKKGKNVITLTNSGKTFNNIDYFEFISEGQIEWYEVDDTHVHTPVESGSSEPTCIKEGQTAGSYCSECDEYVSAPTIIPALGHDWNGTRCERCNAVKFEAENAEIDASHSKTQTTLQGTVASSNYPSGGLYIHHLESSDSLKVTFNITASEAGKAMLSVCMGRREYAIKLSDMWKIKVNGVECSFDPSIEFSVYDSSAPKYYDWYEVEVLIIDLQEGNNVIEFEAASAYSAKLNFDYIALTTDSAALTDEGND